MKGGRLGRIGRGKDAKEYGSYILTLVVIVVALIIGLRAAQPAIADTLRHVMTEVANSL